MGPIVNFMGPIVEYNIIEVLVFHNQPHNYDIMGPMVEYKYFNDINCII